MIFTIQIRETLKNLLIQEDTDGDKKITIEDKGPKEFVIRATSGKNYPIKGTYYLSNLLQELVIKISYLLEAMESLLKEKSIKLQKNLSFFLLKDLKVNLY